MTIKKRAVRIIKALLAYIILNAGVLCWIEVSAASSNKLSPVKTAMAEVSANSDSTFEIAVLGNKTVLDMSFLESDDIQTLFYACGDPVFLSVLSAIDEYSQKAVQI